MYSEITEIKSLLPFTVDDNSIPDSTQIITVQATINGLINGWLGKDEDVSGTPKLLKSVEIVLTRDIVLAWHEDRPYRIGLTKDTKIMLDTYKPEDTIHLGNLVIGS
jgi:hypothetical protein